MKLSEFNKILRAIKAEYTDINISVNGRVIECIEVRETTAGSIASIEFFPTRPVKEIALGKVLKTKKFSLYPLS